MAHQMEYRKASAAQAAMIEESMGFYRAIYDWVVGHIPESRERSLALTNLEQSGMWANKAIAFHLEE